MAASIVVFNELFVTIPCSPNCFKLYADFVSVIFLPHGKSYIATLVSQ